MPVTQFRTAASFLLILPNDDRSIQLPLNRSLEQSAIQWKHPQFTCWSPVHDRFPFVILPDRARPTLWLHHQTIDLISSPLIIVNHPCSHPELWLIETWHTAEANQNLDWIQVIYSAFKANQRTQALFHLLEYSQQVYLDATFYASTPPSLEVKGAAFDDWFQRAQTTKNIGKWFTYLVLLDAISFPISVPLSKQVETTHGRKPLQTSLSYPLWLLVEQLYEMKPIYASQYLSFHGFHLPDFMFQKQNSTLLQLETTLSNMTFYSFYKQRSCHLLQALHLFCASQLHASSHDSKYALPLALLHCTHSIMLHYPMLMKSCYIWSAIVLNRDFGVDFIHPDALSFPFEWMLRYAEKIDCKTHRERMLLSIQLFCKIPKRFFQFQQGNVNCMQEWWLRSWHACCHDSLCLSVWETETILSSTKEALTLHFLEEAHRSATSLMSFDTRLMVFNRKALEQCLEWIQVFGQQHQTHRILAFIQTLKESVLNRTDLDKNWREKCLAIVNEITASVNESIPTAERNVTCSICCNANESIKLIPCQHCLCNHCADRLSEMGNKCFFCTQTVNGFEKIENI